MDGAFLGDELSCDNKMPYELYAQVTSRLRTALDALPGEHGQACARRLSPGCFLPPPTALWLCVAGGERVFLAANECHRIFLPTWGGYWPRVPPGLDFISLDPCKPRTLCQVLSTFVCSYKPIFSVAQFKPFEICCTADITQTTAGGEAYYNGSNETAQVRALYEAELFPRMAPHQKAWAVPGAFSPPAGPQTPVLDKLQ